MNFSSQTLPSTGAIAAPENFTHTTSAELSRWGVAAAVSGNALEFYDFIAYSFFATYIGKTFFPVGSEYASLLVSVAVFGVGFFTRPLGGVLIGAYADRAGRKAAMILTVILITAGTLGLAATPSYASIGIAAPIIVVLCRLMQGLALGGDVGAASSLLLEAAPRGRRGLYASWQIASQGLAVMAAGIVGYVVSSKLSPTDLASWGWRVPFLLSLLLIPVALVIRRSLPETLKQAAPRGTGEIVTAVMRDRRREVVVGVLALLSATIATQIGNYMTTFSVQTLKLSPTISQMATLLMGLTTFAFALIGGWLSDRVGRKAVMVVPRVLTLLLVVPLFQWLVGSPSASTLMGVTFVMGALTGAGTAATMVAIPELMPASLRGTGTAIVYAVGATIFGGTTQFVVTWLIHTTGDATSPAWYLMATTLLSLFAMVWMPETRYRSIED